MAIASGCGGSGSSSHGVTVEWIAGHEAPIFDPDGPPDALRWALERHLSRGLTEEDSSGHIVPAAADSIAVLDRGLTLRFRLPEDLRYSDGSRCSSADFRAALQGGLGRVDHGTRGALLASLRGVEGVRPGRPLPPLGIETPDARTLILRLSRPDSLLLRKLSLPGVSSPWRRRGAIDWNGAIGLGPYHVAEWESGRRMTLVRGGARGRSDTLRVRFVATAARVRNLLRAGRADLVWPVPSALLDQPLPPGFRTVTSDPRPKRDLLLVQRADVPPTTGLAARSALAHALNRTEVVSELGGFVEPPAEWIAGAPPFEAPKFDEEEVTRWLDRGHLGRSFHVAMAFDQDGEGAVAARTLQGGWSRFNLYAELRGLKGPAFATEALRGQSQLVLVEHQPLIERPEWQAQELIMPLRGPAVGAFRTGWRTREFDPWLLGRAGMFATLPAVLQRRIEEEALILPLARLPWLRVTRDAAPAARFHPHFGPDFLDTVAAPVKRPKDQPRR